MGKGINLNRFKFLLIVILLIAFSNYLKAQDPNNKFRMIYIWTIMNNTNQEYFDLNQKEHDKYNVVIWGKKNRDLFMELKKSIGPRKIYNLPINIKLTESIDSLADCQILYFTSSDQEVRDGIISKLDGTKAILIEEGNTMQDNSMCYLFNDGRYMKYSLNIKEFVRKGIEINQALKTLGKNVDVDLKTLLDKFELNKNELESVKNSFEIQNMDISNLKNSNSSLTTKIDNLNKVIQDKEYQIEKKENYLKEIDLKNKTLEKSAKEKAKELEGLENSVFIQRNTLKKQELILKNQEQLVGKQNEKIDAQSKAISFQEKEIKTQKKITYLSLAFIILISIFAIYIYKSYVEKKKASFIINQQKLEVEKQKTEIQRKNKDIIDSISYALRIQQAKLPSKSEIKRILPDSFILFKPKDIVSGDFYYFHNSQKLFYIVAGDCTGHGVPGAFMSLIGMEKLDDAFAQSNNNSDVLQHLNVKIKNSLRQSDADDSTRDGMDLALCAINVNSKKIQYAGANRPLWLIRKGAGSIEEIKATKKAIGGFTEDNQHFEAHELQLETGDCFYIFSDGYADTFGGEFQKKLTTRRFKELLISINDKSMMEQELYLSKFIDDWKGDTEQIDDILVIGVRV